MRTVKKFLTSAWMADLIYPGILGLLIAWAMIVCTGQY